MKRVLIWKGYEPGTQFDIYRTQNCAEQIGRMLGGEFFNIGNRLWLQGLMSVIDTGENEYIFRTPDMTPDFINDQFDFIIMPEANLFSRAYQGIMLRDAPVLEKIRIPAYMIACGAEVSSYDALDDLARDIGDASRRFIAAVYRTGGEFALRGEFTKALFNRFGENTAVVTGCPSMFQMGRGFTVTGTDPKQDVRPVFNGRVPCLQKLLQQYPESLLMDQANFLRDIYQPRQGKPGFQDMYSLYRRGGMYSAQLLRDDRIRLIPDMYSWRTFLQRCGANYSFGTRIHGSIMPILSGIPATVVAIDSRTREMAEFFDIPHVLHKPGHVYTREELLQHYAAADYATFNETYPRRFDAYEKFLVEHGIVSHINGENAFFAEKEYFPPEPGVNQDYYGQAARWMQKNGWMLELTYGLVRVKKKLRR